MRSQDVIFLLSRQILNLLRVCKYNQHYFKDVLEIMETMLQKCSYILATQKDGSSSNRHWGPLCTLLLVAVWILQANSPQLSIGFLIVKGVRMKQKWGLLRRGYNIDLSTSIVNKEKCWEKQYIPKYRSGLLKRLPADFLFGKVIFLGVVGLRAYYFGIYIKATLFVLVCISFYYDEVEHFGLQFVSLAHFSIRSPAFFAS